MISQKRIEDHKELYARYKTPTTLLEKIIHIPNAIELPGNLFAKDDKGFTVLYVGRGTEEKRVKLVTITAKQLYDKKENVDFEIMGDVSQSINKSTYPFIKFHENISDENMIGNIYSRAHILMLTSSTEGFPMVIMEAMAYGCVILSTAVGDIPYHVRNNENGFLFINTDNEVSIIKEATEKITWLNNNRDHVTRIAANNIEYAKNNFGIERFNKDYRELLLSVNKKS
jgi:glycosyltransferase involved in cell wall biosynthesis